MNRTAYMLIAAFLMPVFCCAQDDPSGCTLTLFYSDSCPHCHSEMAWLDSIRGRYPGLNVEEYEISRDPELFRKVAEEYNTSAKGVPRTFIGEMAFVGFSKADGELMYRAGYNAYTGNANQMESAVRDCLGNGPQSSSGAAVKVSMETEAVRGLLERSPGSVSTISMVGGVYLVAWWSPERLSSSLGHPDILVRVSAGSMEVDGVTEPEGAVEGVRKPLQGVTWAQLSPLALIMFYLIAYLLLQNRLRVSGKMWLAGFILLVAVFVIVLFLTMPSYMIGSFLQGFFGTFMP